MKLFTSLAFPKNAQRGFTLVEALVAIMILAFAIVGPFTLSAQSLRASRDARDELTATYLASEAIEIVHNIRDNNSADDATANHTNWMNNISANCLPNGCVTDITEQQSVAPPSNIWKSSALVACPPGLCPDRSDIYFNPVTGLYRQGSSALAAPWQKTSYSRFLTITVVSANQIHLTSTVTYLGYGNKRRTLSIGEDFYNWFPPFN